MSGLALILDSQEPVAPGNEAFKAFKDSVAGFKQLNSTCWEVSGRHCAAAGHVGSRGISFGAHR